MATTAEDKICSTNAGLNINQQTSLDEDIVSTGSASVVANVIESNNGQVILSKKAIHQRDADENLFLRFLELDPPTDVINNSIAAVSVGSATNAAVTSSICNTILATPARRPSTFPKTSTGRTPFTVTKRLTRTAELGFGFSIVWTHPPRVEKIEPGLSAAQCGILPGDYVIFVDKHNVVTMPEADVLNLIKSQGNNLILEIFRRQPATGIPPLTLNSIRSASTAVSTKSGAVYEQNLLSNGLNKSRVASIASTNEYLGSPALKPPESLNLLSSVTPGPRCSNIYLNSSIETTKRKLQLPQVTFSKESIGPATDMRKRFLLQLISREQNFVSAIQFGMQRYVLPLQERKVLISPNDHRTLFQNIDELMRISQDILEQLLNENHDQNPQMNFTSRVYLSKTTAICAAYKKYCNGIKRADCVLVNKSRQPASDFVLFITEPQVPRKRPDLTMLIHRPLQHFREILKLMQILASHSHVDSEEQKNFICVINELQAAYREITVGGGLMEPLGEGRPLLTLQDLEARMVFTRCKPFALAVPGRQWIFGGDLSRVEGRSIKPYWTLLFSDIIVFAKVSRDRVLFITEEPLPIANIVDSCFNLRKKNTEFRITVDPNGRVVESPTAYCAPDLTKTPKKNTRRKSLILRAPSLELKAVWQNLLQRQIFLVNTAFGSTPLSSPLDSPDVLNTLVPLSDIGAATTSIASIKLASMDSLNSKNQQQQQHRKINPAQHMETLIDEKCRILNKTGTSKASALHLANWMKGQLDKQQEQARLVAITHMEALENSNKDERFLLSEEYEEENMTFWTKEQLEKRTKELNFAKENPGIKPLHRAFGGKRLSGAEIVAFSDVESDLKSPSRSTTSDSQITVRSSPNPKIIDKLSVCRHCHKNCKQSLFKQSDTPSSPHLLSNSLKVQHSQASPNRCCKVNGITITSSLVEEIPFEPFNARDEFITNSNIKNKSSTVKNDQHSSEISFTQTKKNIENPFHSYPNSVSSVPITNIINFESESETERSNSTISPETTFNKIIESSIKITNIVNPTSENKRGDIETSFKQENPVTEKMKSHAHTDHTNQIRKSPSLGLSSLLFKSSTCQKFIKTYDKNFVPCNCKCQPEDFSNTTISPDELKQETCRLIEDVTKISKINKLNEYFNEYNFPEKRKLHGNCKCLCDKSEEKSLLKTAENDDDLSLVLIGLAQLTPTSKLINSKEVVPLISVVPPTPENILSKTCTNIWDNQSSEPNVTQFNSNLSIKRNSTHIIMENLNDTPDDSPLDEDPPYRPMNTSLRRFGTLSSLEKLACDENQNAENTDEDDDVIDLEHDEEEIQVITKEIFDSDQEQTTLRNWTSKAGSYVAGKISFFEESRAFLDKYLGRWSGENYENDEDHLEECASGATSGEEVWGTPTSGGDNDDLQMLNLDITQSSPTKSSGSLNDDDDDTELMMDELLMAPPMSASTLRGLLPRRRLEPLFEEETESDEEKTQLENEEIKKGDMATNGHGLTNSSGSSSEEESEKAIATPISTHKPIIKKVEESNVTNIQDGKITPTRIQLRLKQMQLQKKNFLMMKEAGLITTSSQNSTIKAKNIPIRETAISTTAKETTQDILIQGDFHLKEKQPPVPRQINQQKNGNVTPILTRTMRVLKTSAITTIMNNEKNSISVEEAYQTTTTKTKSKGSPPPPPPRRLFLTKPSQIQAGNGSELTNKQVRQTQKFGDTADTGLGVVIIHPQKHYQIDNLTKQPLNQKDAYSIRDCVVNTDLVEKENSKNNLKLAQAETKSVGILEKEAILIQQSHHQAEKSIANTDMESAQNFSHLSPRLEMRLALNHEILGDEDLISYNPGPDLTKIFGCDLSTYHRRTGKDLLNLATLNRSGTNRIQPTETVISFYQQRNSKMDTPTVKRRQQQLRGQNTLTNPNIWNSSAFVDPIKQLETNKNNLRKLSNSSEGSRISDLEHLAKQEKMYCMSQLKNGSPVKNHQLEVKEKSMSKLATKTMTTVLSSQETTVTTIRRRSFSIAVDDNSENDSLLNVKPQRGLGKTSRLYNFLIKRNSENHLNKMLSENSITDSTENGSSHRLNSLLSPRKDNDKTSLNRRFWKQLTKRRRSSSVSQF